MRIFIATIRNRSAFDQEIGHRIFADNPFITEHGKAWISERIEKAIKRDAESDAFGYDPSDFETTVTISYIY